MLATRCLVKVGHVAKLGHNRAAGVGAAAHRVQRAPRVVDRRKLGKHVAEQMVGHVFARVQFVNHAVLAQLAVHVDVELDKEPVLFRRVHRRALFRLL